MEKFKKVGRPKLNIDKVTLSAEIQKYLNGEQKEKVILLLQRN